MTVQENPWKDCKWQNNYLYCKGELYTDDQGFFIMNDGKYIIHTNIPPEERQEDFKGLKKRLDDLKKEIDEMRSKFLQKSF
jgi:hypothetical protein